MKKFIERWSALALSMLAIAAITLYVVKSGMLEEINVGMFHWQYFALMIPLRAVFFGLNGLTLAVFTAQAGVHLSAVEWYGLAITSALSNLIMPFTGGAIMRAGYLKMRHSFPISHFSALLAANYLITFLVSGLAGLIVVTAMSLSGYRPVSWVIAGLMAGMAIVPALAMSIPLERIPIPRGGRLMHGMHLALEGWYRIRTSRPLLVKQTILTLALQLIQAISLNLALLGLGYPTPLVDTLLVGILTNLAIVVRVTPGGLGLSEALAGLGAELVGISPTRGVAAAVLTRLSGWCLIFTLGPVFVLVLTRQMQEHHNSALCDAQGGGTVPNSDASEEAK